MSGRLVSRVIVRVLSEAMTSPQVLCRAHHLPELSNDLVRRQLICKF